MPAKERSRNASGPQAGPVLSPHLASPGKLILVTVALVFAIEFLIMVWIETGHLFSEQWEPFFDAAILSLLLTPVLHFTLHRPLVSHADQLKRSAEALRYSERKYGAVVENSPAGIFIYRNRRLAFANDSLVEMFGGSREELLQIDPAELVMPEYREKLLTLVDHGPTGESLPREMELQLQRGDGEGRWVNVRTAIIEYRGSDSVLGIVQDVSNRKHLEEELRLLSSQRLKVQEEERGRLARELHDGVGQALSAVKFTIEHTLGHEYPNERRGQVEQLRALIPKIQDTVEEVRRMSMALRPATLDDLGLVATITWFLRELQQSCPHMVVEKNLAVAETDIPDHLRIVIYRTLQEALNNAAKHCGNCTVWVSLERSDGEIRLTVEDDGVGFCLEEVRGRDVARRGYGLGSMRERVELSAGRFTLETEPGGGAVVHASWVVGEG